MERDRLVALEREQAKQEAKKRYQEVICTGNKTGPGMRIYLNYI